MAEHMKESSEAKPHTFLLDGATDLWGLLGIVTILFPIGKAENFLPVNRT